MYEQTLRITTFGVEGHLVDALRSCTAARNFTHTFAAYDAFDVQAFTASDLVIVDLRACLGRRDEPLAAGFRATPVWNTLHSHLEDRLHRPSAEMFSTVPFKNVVVIAAPEDEAHWTPEDYTRFDAVWPPHMSDARLVHEFTRIQLDAKQAAAVRFAWSCLTAIGDVLSDMLWLKSPDGSHMRVNTAFCEQCGKSKEDVFGRKDDYIWNLEPEDLAENGEFVCSQSDAKTLEAGTVCHFTEQVKTVRGVRQLSVAKAPLYNQDGSPLGVIGIAHDVTDFGNISTELDILINSLPYALVIEDVDGVITNANKTALSYFPTSGKRVIGKPFEEWRRAFMGDDFAYARKTDEASEFSCLVRGQMHIFSMVRTPVVDVFGNDAGAVRLYRDITVERLMEQRIERNARTDYLTGLFNRRYFYQYCDENLGGDGMVFVSLDLDNLKHINDRYGHSDGDEALTMVARMLQEAFPNDLAMRWGGDEFSVAMFGEHDLDDVESRVAALLDKMPFASAEREKPWVLSLSAGVAGRRGPDVELETLISHADEALYRAKRLGKACCCVYRNEDSPWEQRS